MKIIFCSNYFTPHQQPMSECLDSLTNHNYFFIGHKEMDADRKLIGWGDCYFPSYVKNPDEATNINNIDVLISGSFPEELLSKYKKNAKLFFRYSERPLKKGNEWLKYPIKFFNYHQQNPKSKNAYMLCASAYTSLDYHRFGLFNNRCYKWGYFTRTKYYDDLNKIIKNKSKNTILWCGRLLDWKHPDDAVWAASQLKSRNIPFELNIIGSGPMEKQLKAQIKSYNLEDCVHLIGALRSEKVREYMEKSGVFLLTSDRNEGWGAVVNEAMNSCCAVVASHIAGSVPYLIDDKKNGLVYRYGKRTQLVNKLETLIKNPSLQTSLGIAAYHTIVDLWNADIAAKRFICLCEHLLSGENYPILYSSGPCSPAEIISESWYKD